MNVSLMQIFAALAMVGTAIVLLIAYRSYLANNSERRMRTMLESVGLDPAIAASGEIPAIMKEVRQRCRSCASEDACEHWLAGDKKDGNDFCPNAKVFEILNKYSDTAA
jgi:hypothetical protein